MACMNMESPKTSRSPQLDLASAPRMHWELTSNRATSLLTITVNRIGNAVKVPYKNTVPSHEGLCSYMIFISQYRANSCRKRAVSLGTVFSDITPYKL